MKDNLKKNRIKIIVVLIAILFSAYIINGINEHSIIPDHIHSVDDKAPDERTDTDNIIILERILQKNPGNINIMNNLSELYIKTDNEKSAKKILREILDIDPYNNDAVEHLKKLE